MIGLDNLLGEKPRMIIKNIIILSFILLILIKEIVTFARQIVFLVCFHGINQNVTRLRIHISVYLP